MLALVAAVGHETTTNLLCVENRPSLLQRWRPARALLRLGLSYSAVESKPQVLPLPSSVPPQHRPSTPPPTSAKPSYHRQPPRPRPQPPHPHQLRQPLLGSVRSALPTSITTPLPAPDPFLQRTRNSPSPTGFAPCSVSALPLLPVLLSLHFRFTTTPIAHAKVGLQTSAPYMPNNSFTSKRPTAVALPSSGQDRTGRGG